jgi:aryl-alcohol dehydrogenase-like predicted oxidoreductase
MTPASASTPAIGFGCASLGSRVAKADGLAALARAYEAGITWFDVAPAYGDGQAESILGDFVRDRGSVQVVTKVGLVPGDVSMAKRLMRPVARAALGAMPGLRGAIRRARPANEKVPLTGEVISASIDASLSRLGLDQVEALMLHDATIDDVRDAGVVRALGEVLASGKARHVGIASSVEVVLAGRAASDLYSLFQVANNPFQRATAVAAALGEGPSTNRLVTHSVLGADGHVERLVRLMGADADVARAMADAGYDESPRAAAVAFMTDYALTTQGVDVVLMSMFQPRHMAANLARIDRMRSAGTRPGVSAVLAMIDHHLTRREL